MFGENEKKEKEEVCYDRWKPGIVRFIITFCRCQSRPAPTDTSTIDLNVKICLVAFGVHWYQSGIGWKTRWWRSLLEILESKPIQIKLKWLWLTLTEFHSDWKIIIRVMYIVLSPLIHYAALDVYCILNRFNPTRNVKIITEKYDQLHWNSFVMNLLTEIQATFLSLSLFLSFCLSFLSSLDFFEGEERFLRNAIAHFSESPFSSWKHWSGNSYEWLKDHLRHPIYIPINRPQLSRK